MNCDIDIVNWLYRVTKWPDILSITKSREDAELFAKYGTNEIVLIYSGWLDSTTVLYDLLDRGYKVLAFSVYYWQKHSQELERAKKFCKRLGVEQIILNLSSIDLFKSSGLVNKDINLKDGLYTQENIEISMVPNRNSILANFGLGIAMNRKAIWIALGIHSEDKSTGEIEYPDCSPAFVKSLQTLAREIDFRPYEVIVPFSGKHKGDVVKRGLELNVPYEDTWSCYKWQENWKACGVCGTCIQRLNAFKSNGAVDPIEYETKI